MIYDAPLITRGYSLPNGNLIVTRGFKYEFVLVRVRREVKRLISLITRSFLFGSLIILRVEKDSLIDIDRDLKSKLDK